MTEVEESGGGFDWSFDEASVEPAEAPPPQPRPPLRRLPVAGEDFGPYAIRGELGRGGMGAVLRAFDPELRREVALKVVTRPGSERRERFLREALITASLQHPGIVTIHSAAEIEGLPTIAYELVEGARTLEEALPELPRLERVRLVRDAARALGFAHAQGIVHRDVKPENLLLDRAGRLRVADFGLAVAQDLERLTQTGAFVGTPHYMAPEQYLLRRREPVGPAADVWSLGVVLYRALTDELPFKAATLLELGAQVSAGRIRPPRSLDPSLSPALEAVCLQALATDSTQRYSHGAAFAADLDRVLAGERPTASAVARRGPRPRAGLRGVAFLGVLLLTLGLGWLLSLAGEDDRALLRQAQALSLLRQRTRDLERRLAQAFDARRALASEPALPATLRRELTELADETPAAAPRLRAELRELGRRLLVLEGLTALATERRERAQEVLTAARQAGAGEGPPRAELLEAALVASRGEDPVACARAAQVLEEALRGLSRPELRAWRARAHWAAGSRAPADARRGLRDLGALARARGGLARADALLRVRLLLAAGQVAAARERLDALAAPPRELRLHLILAEAELGLAADDLEPVLARLGALEPTPAELAAGRDPDPGELAQRCRDAAATSAADRDELLRRLPQTLAQLRLARRLQPRQPVPPAILEALLDLLFARFRNQDLAVAISELAPDDFAVQWELADRATSVGDVLVLTRMIPIIERALALAPTVAQRQALEAVHCFVLAECRQDEACFALGTRLLPTLSDPLQRGKVLRALSAVRARRGDVEGALRDLDGAIAVLPTIESKMHYYRAGLLLRLGREAEAYPAALLHALHGPRSAKQQDAVCIAWRLGRPDERYDELLPAVRRLLELRPELGGWWTRAAWLELRLARPAEASASLRQAAALFRAANAATLRRLAARTQRLALSLVKPAEHKQAGAELDELVQHLDALRGRGMDP